MPPQTKDENAAALEDLNSLKEAINEVGSEDEIVYTEEELDAIRQVKAKLDQDPDVSCVNPRFLAYTVIVTKNRVDESVKKYKKLLSAVKTCGLPTVEADEDLWNDPKVEDFLRKYYQVCGRDFQGRSILWIKGDKIPVELEATSIRAGLLYTVAIHADVKSLREGITFVIDVSRGSTEKKVGNESKLQRVNQCYPTRPQAILLAGASIAYRVVVNSIIRVASLFTKQKILQRISFVSIDQAKEKIPIESAPVYVGGGGGGIEDVVQWTKERYYKMPLPQL